MSDEAQETIEAEGEEIDTLLTTEEQVPEDTADRMLWPEDLFDLVSTPTSAITAGHDPQPGVADADLSPEEVLERYWGYTAFRPLQRELIESVLQGRDTLGLLPTGGGKSIIFQVPDLCSPDSLWLLPL